MDEQKQRSSFTHLSLSRNHPLSLLKVTTFKTHFRHKTICHFFTVCIEANFPEQWNKTEPMIIAADINCIYDDGTAIQSTDFHHRCRAGTGWCVRRAVALDVCQSFSCVTLSIVYMMNVSCGAHLYLTGGTVRRVGPTRSRWIPFDCFIVVPVFPSDAATSHLSVLPHPVNPLQTHEHTGRRSLTDEASPSHSPTLHLSLHLVFLDDHYDCSAGTILRRAIAGAFKVPRASEIWKSAAKNTLFMSCFMRKSNSKKTRTFWKGSS